MSEKIIKDQEETKEETKIGSEEIVKNGETKTGSEEIVKNEEKEVPEKVDANSSFWSKVKHFLKYSIQTWIARCFLIAFGLELLMEILGRRSLVLGVKFMVSSPIVFLYNTSIIFFIVCVVLKKAGIRYRVDQYCLADLRFCKLCGTWLSYHTICGD